MEPELPKLALRMIEQEVVELVFGLSQRREILSTLSPTNEDPPGEKRPPALGRALSCPCRQWVWADPAGAIEGGGRRKTVVLIGKGLEGFQTT